MNFQEETLMFSSLNVIEEAEYTFYTAFQDHRYKVTSSSHVTADKPEFEDEERSANDCKLWKLEMSK